ncbi:MAG: HDOD domain-containing protein [Methylomonas sp.]|nr:HDOD domain-containing protein [Methylomonas sp.]PPD21062.1 MAG: hypothetical protein CTY23_06865 [Methylomonas sp.]PPD25308.1 MAG: hypothetical protein CTY22_09185 [Methylomonas sp.]PPD35286.1 MAG: hypothetical protein CTY21_09185 [Methylomonas sp.]PPD38501.1 MAG: hypothetical protein CTY17_09285 [Methylomonas sp.]
MPVKNILFVDDDALVLNGIQRQFRTYRSQWQLFFASNGPDALELMAQQPIDLIVSDMMMPTMRGDELLTRVSEQYPGTVRMILSGHTDEASLKRGLEVAHQHLGKPCPADTLHETIGQIFKIQACLKNRTLIAELGDANQLPSLPETYQQLNQAMGDENTSNQAIAAIFAKDMVLSAKLLHLVNSPYFGLRRTVSSLTEAISMVGIQRLNSLVLSVHVRQAFPVTDANSQRYMEYLWQDAGRVAELARQIALSEDQQGDRPDQAYLGGLLHNLGLLVFLSRGGNKLKRLMEQVKTTDTPVSELETAVFGFNRSEAAAYILALWKIPPRIIEAILLQNTPSATDYDGVNALTAVHAAGCLLKPGGMQDDSRLFDMSLDEAYLQRIDKWQRLPAWQALADNVANQ